MLMYATLTETEGGNPARPLHIPPASIGQAGRPDYQTLFRVED
jgi:hypothetical protein